MEKSILQCLENTTKKFPNKLAFEDINRGATYKEFTENCRKVGTGLTKLNEINGGSANNINMDFYGYKMNSNDFNNFKELLKSSDENDSIKVDSIIDEIYEKYKKQYKIDDWSFQTKNNML